MLEFKKDWLIINNIDISSIKKEINSIIKNLIPESLKGVTTHGENSKQYDLTNHIKSSLIVNKIENKIIECLFNKFKYKFNLSLISSWTVLGQEHGYHTLHKHNYDKDKPLHVASVIYLDVPKTLEKEDLKETNNFYCLFNNNNDIKYYSHNPKIGDLMVFPVWLWHGAYPQGKGMRQTLNMDFKIKV